MQPQAGDSAHAVAGQGLEPVDCCDRHAARLFVQAGERVALDPDMGPPAGVSAQRVGQHGGPADIEGLCADARQLPIDDPGETVVAAPDDPTKCLFSNRE